MKDAWKSTQIVLAPNFFTILSIVLKLDTPLLHICSQAQKTFLQIFEFRAVLPNPAIFDG